MNTISEFESTGTDGFVSWLDTFVEEKGLDSGQLFEKEGPSGLNIIPMGVVIAAMKTTNGEEQARIKSTLVRLDFVNADAVGFFEHLAGALVI